MSAAVYEGGCLCGAVRYRAQGEPLSVPFCHCSMCRRASGAHVVAWATFPSSAFAWVRGEPVRYASSPRATRQFCGRCGSPLTFQFNKRPEEIDLTVGTLDEPERLPPTYHVFVRERVRWQPIADGLPQYEGFRDEPA